MNSINPTPDLSEWTQKAARHHQAGRFAEAEQGYLEVLQNDAKHFHALRLLGALYLQQDKYAEAEPCLRQALEMAPENLELLNNIGIALHQKNQRLDEAQNTFEKVLRLNPDHIEALTNSGKVLSDLGEIDQALTMFVRALCLQAYHLPAWAGLDALLNTGKMPEQKVIDALRQIIKKWPENADIIARTGNALFGYKRHDEAMICFNQALSHDPDCVTALMGSARIFYEQKRFDVAKQKYEKVLQLQPDFPEALTNLGAVLAEMGTFDDALAYLQKASALSPHNTDILFEYAAALALHGKTQMAAEKYNEILRIYPDHVGVLINMGILNLEWGNTPNALRFYQKALLVDPANRRAQFERSLALLALGNYREGWASYEAGMGHAEMRGLPLFKSKMWDGTARLDKIGLIWCEQGLGDALQFIRYAALCKQRFAKLYVVCYSPLVRLFYNCPFIDGVFTAAQEGAFDEHISVMSLPYLFGTMLETIPAHIPYLYVSAATRAKWAGKVVPTRKLKVGLAWAGNPRKEQFNAHMIDRRRSMSLEALHPIFSIPNVQFYNLQLGEATDQIDACGLRNHFIDLMPDVSDFEDTAAIVEQLDLVIAVDTSIVHLAGGLGKPIWVLSRFDACWRWLQNQETNPWYPTARVFGQPASGDWASVVTKLYWALATEALKVTPDNADNIIAMGNALYRQGKIEDAKAHYEKALHLNPDAVDALVNLGAVYWTLNRFDEAANIFEHALRIVPDHVHALAELGATFAAQGKWDQAREKYHQVLRLNPHHTNTLANLGVLAQAKGERDKALAFFEQALAADPAHRHAQFEKGLALLARGDYRQGWPLYETGLGRVNARGLSPFSSPMWDGTLQPDKTLLIWCEQGLGDALQFIRYAALCKEKFAKVRVLCYPLLLPLLRNCLFIDDVTSTVQEGSFDQHISIMSLPYLFDTVLETIPTQVPYLYVGENAYATWAAKIAHTDKIRVGLVWAGDPRKYQPSSNLVDQRRSINLEALRPLFDIPNVQFYNLQLGEAVTQIDVCGLRNHFIDLMPDVKNFEDTAAIVEQLDLVISVDTSIVHLVGGLAKPIWVLSRFDACWRWLQNREINPWYPTARVFGQPAPGDWASVIVTVHSALQEIALAPRKG